jgi:hypothetical protein
MASMLASFWYEERSVSEMLAVNHHRPRFELRALQGYVARGGGGGGAGPPAGAGRPAGGRGGSTAIVNTGYGPTRVAHHSIDAHFTIYS